MPDTHEPNNAPGVDGNVFVEDIDATFDWKKIPLEGWICLPIFWVLAGVVFWQFFTRYALSNSAVWTEEIARQLLVLLTFFGAGYALRTRAHICISFFVLMFKGGSQKIVNELSALLQLAFYAYSFVLCLKIAKLTEFQMLMSFDVSKSLVYYAVAVAFAGMTLRTGADVFTIFRSYRKSRSAGNGSTL